MTGRKPSGGGQRGLVQEPRACAEGNKPEARLERKRKRAEVRLRNRNLRTANEQALFEGTQRERRKARKQCQNENTSARTSQNRAANLANIAEISRIACGNLAKIACGKNLPGPARIACENMARTTKTTRTTDPTLVTWHPPGCLLALLREKFLPIKGLFKLAGLSKSLRVAARQKDFWQSLCLVDEDWEFLTRQYDHFSEMKMCHFAEREHPMNHTLYLTDTFSAASRTSVCVTTEQLLGRYFRGDQLQRYAVTGPCVDKFMQWCLHVTALGLPSGTVQTTTTCCSDPTCDGLCCSDPAQIQLVWERYQGEQEKREAVLALQTSTPSEAFGCLQLPGLSAKEDRLRIAKEFLMKMMPDYRPLYEKRI